jgi:transcriptional regulator GlxA family with amidase domain
VVERLLIPYFGPSFAPRRLDLQDEKALERLSSFLRSHPTEILHPGDLQRVLNVGARRLHAIFQDHFGMSPGRYLRLRRLNNAHRDLKRGRHDGSPVTEVAINHGFFDIGRFSSAYRKIFAEYPSSTAKRHTKEH